MGPASLCHPLAGLMWTLALGGVFLATAQACVLCHLSDRDLSGRLARLCNQVKARWETCEASWTFPAFALDEVSTNKVIEKTHRVLRVMEIKGSPSSLPLYWQWLQKVKFPEYTREAFCAPACRGSTVLYNCSTCQSFAVHCWPLRRCLPGPDTSKQKATCEDSLPAPTSFGRDPPAPHFQSQRLSLPDPKPSRLRDPSVRWPPGAQAPTAGKFLPSGPQLISQKQSLIPGKWLQEERTPSTHTHTHTHTHTPPPPHPLLPVLGKRGLFAPEAALGPPLTDWESGNEGSGKLPPFGVATTSVSLLACYPSI
uniref:Transmembrane protein 95 n=1 Tax=Felis catus TaxID=9685 RepID=A0ABI7Y286_FELCA